MMKKTYIKNVAVGSFALMAGCLFLSTANIQAASTNYTTTTKNTSKITLEDFDYDLQDKYEAIELDFLSNISLKRNAKVTVKDSSGTSYKTTIHEVDNDDLSLDVTGLKTGKTYTIKIKGIKNSSASKYGTLKIKFSIPKASVSVKEVEYDAEDKEVTFDFNKNVSYQNLKVVITNTSGTKTYSTKVVEQDSNDLSVRVSGLKTGSKYCYKITGVTASGSSTSKTLSGTFTAIDND